tara:strand:- start:151 stop:426 length:276 start_codon:yes stop_codon:yes gene_type:complete
MKTKNNFTIGALSGICITLFLFIIMGSSSPNETAKFEFYDLKDTRGIVFNKVTGEIKYEELREEPLPLESINHSGYIELKNWSGPFRLQSN